MHAFPRLHICSHSGGGVSVCSLCAGGGGGDRWVPPAAPSPSAGMWPPKVVRGLIGLIIGLTWEPLATKRLPVDEAHRRLEALAATVGVDFGEEADF